MDQDLKKDEQTLEENVQSVENKNVAEAKKSEDEAAATVKIVRKKKLPKLFPMHWKPNLKLFWRSTKRKKLPKTRF